MKATISMDEETAGIVKDVKPKNMSEWICGLIKKIWKEGNLTGCLFSCPILFLQ